MLGIGAEFPPFTRETIHNSVDVALTLAQESAHFPDLAEG